METSQSSKIIEPKMLDPFIGPRPFTRTRDDQMRFFGRDDEADEIVSLILGHRLTLVYAQSGAGKTSILEAQVGPKLVEYGFEILPRTRVGIASDSKVELASDNSDKASSNLVNFYMLNAFQTLKPEIDPKSLYDKSLYQFIRDFFLTDNKGNGERHVLVLDQLEELFTFYPGNTWKQQQEDFFEQIAEVLDNTTELRIVIVIREDFLAELDRFTGILPERLRPRFRLERLQHDAALLAIKGPIERLKYVGIDNKYSEQEIESQIEVLIKELLKIQVEDPFSGKPSELDGQFVEPIHLQIVCQKWWQELSSGKASSQARLKLLANVDTALTDFYEGIVHEAASETNISEGIIRKLCEEKLITSSGTRAFVHRGALAQLIQG
jgi:conflict system STAND superfamily ATPase